MNYSSIVPIREEKMKQKVKHKKSKETLLIIYKLRLEDLFNQDNEYRMSEFIEKKVNPIYEKYPYAQVCIEVNC
jgi:hypothetical protein